MTKNFDENPSRIFYRAINTFIYLLNYFLFRNSWALFHPRRRGNRTKSGGRRRRERNWGSGGKTENGDWKEEFDRAFPRLPPTYPFLMSYRSSSLLFESGHPIPSNFCRSWASQELLDHLSLSCFRNLFPVCHFCLDDVLCLYGPVICPVLQRFCPADQPDTLKVNSENVSWIVMEIPCHFMSQMDGSLVLIDTEFHEYFMSLIPVLHT